MRVSNKVTGVISVQNLEREGEFDEDHRNLLATIANQAAVAIENAQLYTQTDRALATRVAELETLSQIDHDLNARLDLERVAELTRQWAMRGANAHRGWVALYDEEMGFRIVAAPPGSQPANLQTLLEQMKNEEPPKQFVTSGDGSLSYCVTPIIHTDRTIGAIIVAAPQTFDSTARPFLIRLAHRAAAALENARLYEAVEAANEAKSQFVSIVTHELRIPLTSIKGYAELIRQGVVGEINEQQVEFLNVINANVERMSRLISDLSDISRIERGKLRLEYAHFSLPERIEETIHSLQHKIREKSQSLDTQLAPDLPKVYADPNRFVQILTNLLSNAWKYTPEGGRISIVAFPEGEHVRVEVRDSGIGISEEDQAKLFTQFFRSESPQVREQVGWGLGLNVTRRLVELMGGNIGVQSQLGKGSTFWFTLPVTPPEEAEASSSEAPPEEAETAPQPVAEETQEVAASAKKVVLSIDDSAQVINLYERYLSDHGYQVVPLTNPAEAVERARELRPYAITLDIMMPNIDGWAVLEALKSNPETRDIPVLVCSIVRDEEKGFSLGATDYLVKPILEEDLLHALKRLDKSGDIHRVLVVDDTDEDLRLVERIIRQYTDYEPMLAPGGQAALSVLQNSDPDAIILDLYMPDLDGFTLLETIRNDPRLHDLPVLILTGGDLTAEQRALLNEKSQALVHKSELQEEEFLERLKELLEGLES
jgi:signal transduction histidine kinase/CheY-like chemotaxis protein